MAGVKTTHKDYDRHAPQWKRCRDVISGQDAVRKAKEAYLPKLENETEEDYAARIKRSDFWNGTWRTIDALTGMVFRKSPTVDVPAGIEAYLDDVTLTGVSMEEFAEQCVTERLSVGPVGILVDHPPQPDNVRALTVDAAQRLGLRPTLQIYMAESIRNWKRKRINNSWVYSQVRLEEKHEVDKDEFETECVTRYRVLDLDEAGQYRQRVFEVKDDKDVLVEGPIYPLMNGRPLDYIPFALDGDFDDPPLIDLVDANLALYQINAIYRHTLYFCPPTFYISGYHLNEGEKISIGGTAALVFPDPNAKAAFAEPQGTMVPELREASKEKKQEMALLGARMIADETKQAETLGATQIKRAGENSMLGKIVKGTSRTLEWALGVFAEWAGQKGEITYQLNRDFLPAMMDAQTLNAIFAGVQSGNISKQEAFALLQRGDLIDGEISYDEHQAQIDVDTPSLARPNVPPANDGEGEAA